MTEENVRAIFFKNYSGDLSGQDDLNKALIATFQEITLALLTKHAKGETLPDIVKTIVSGRSRLGLFAAMFMNGQKGRASVPMSYILHFDQMRKAMLDAVNYTHDNYEAMQPEFRQWFTKEALKTMSGDMSEAIEKPTGLPANVRGVRLDELNREEEFFVKALIGIIGAERFQKYADEQNRCNKTLRRCQAECMLLRDMKVTDIKVS